jgi:parallel beta-helix repeat protein
MQKSTIKKFLVFTIIILIIGVNIIPSISGNTVNIKSLYDKKSEIKNINSYSYNTPEIPNIHLDTEDDIYRTTNEFGLHGYTRLTSNYNYDQSDNFQSLKYTKIERTYAMSKIKTTDKNPEFLLSGNIFYVGGSGPNNYTSIQNAINDAKDGDTVFVYNDSSPYYENIIIEKSIQLIGENKHSTIISGSYLDRFVDTINISADNVNIHGFSISDNPGYYYQAAILITGEYASISSCIIYNNNWIGISLIDSHYSQIIDCELYDNLMAIHLVDSNNNVIRDCYCHDNADDILLFSNSHNNQIINCTSINNSYSGIHIQHSSGNEIINCTIQNGYEGIGLAYAPDTKMQGNILINNYENFGIGSSTISDFYCEIDTSNTINGKPIYYWIDYHNQQIPGNAGFIGLISCTNMLVKDLEITNNFQGIVCLNTTNSTIENCNFRNNGGHGAFFVSSYNNKISNCSSRNCFFSGIYLDSQSDNNTIYNNTILNIQVSGVYADSSTSNHFDKNVIKNCGRGISLDKSSNSILRNNEMVNCGLVVDGNILSDYINDADTSNTVNGKTLYYYIDKNGIIIPDDAGEVILVNCTYCNVSNLDLSHGTIGVELAFSSHNEIISNTINSNNLVAIDLDCSSNNNNTIKGNTILNNNYAVDVDSSHYNIFQDNIVIDSGVAFSFDRSQGNAIFGNDIQNSWNGIYLSKSNKNNVNHNSIQECGFNGIYLLYSKDNIVAENEMVNCGLLVYGISLSEYINDVETSNTVNGKTLYYYINENGITVPNDAGEVILINCQYINVSNLNLSDGTIGIELAYSNYNIISNNVLNNNNYAGLYLESSNGNIVNFNTIENNNNGINLQLANNNDITHNKICRCYYGGYIYLSDNNIFTGNNILYNTYGLLFNLPSNNNKIHHNNLIDNGYNAWDENENTNSWDDGKKGNYWGDYKEKYPNARKIWLKGIWNTPYDIPEEENQDRYPLIKPYVRNKGIIASRIQMNILEKILDFFPILKKIIYFS